MIRKFHSQGSWAFIATWPLGWCQGALQTWSVGDLARAGHVAVALRAAAPKRRWQAAVYRQSRCNTAGHGANLLCEILGSGQYREGFAVVALGDAGMGSLVAGPFPSVCPWRSGGHPINPKRLTGTFQGRPLLSPGCHEHDRRKNRGASAKRRRGCLTDLPAALGLSLTGMRQSTEAWPVPLLDNGWILKPGRPDRCNPSGPFHHGRIAIGNLAPAPLTAHSLRCQVSSNSNKMTRSPRVDGDAPEDLCLPAHVGCTLLYSLPACFGMVPYEQSDCPAAP